MAKRRFGVLILLLAVCFLVALQPALAATTAEAKAPIDTQTDCTLTVTYRYEDVAFSGQTVKLYQVAQVSEDFQYTLAEPFSAAGLELNGVKTSGEWNVIRSTLESHILVNQPTPAATAVTDEAGKIVFEALQPGLYFLTAVEVVQEERHCVFDSALVALPGLGEDGYWQYAVSVSAKPEILPPIDGDGETEFKVLKLWKGDEGRTDRPKSIEVEIFRNGESYEIVVLSEENNWCYSWTAEDSATWNVAERNIPSGYTVTVEARETTFILTNTRVPDDPNAPPTPPQTGDTSHVLLYTVLLFVSGGMLILLGILGKGKRHEEE